MIHPITMQELAKTHQRDQRELWRKAEVRRMVRQARAARPAQPGLVERIVDRVGTLLIEIGERLTERCALLLGDHST
jgi:histone H3/H4